MRFVRSLRLLLRLGQRPLLRVWLIISLLASSAGPGYALRPKASANTPVRDALSKSSSAGNGLLEESAGFALAKLKEKTTTLLEEAKSKIKAAQEAGTMESALPAVAEGLRQEFSSLFKLLIENERLDDAVDFIEYLLRELERVDRKENMIAFLDEPICYTFLNECMLIAREEEKTEKKDKLLEIAERYAKKGIEFFKGPEKKRWAWPKSYYVLAEVYRLQDRHTELMELSKEAIGVYAGRKEDVAVFLIEIGAAFDFLSESDYHHYHRAKLFIAETLYSLTRNTEQEAKATAYLLSSDITDYFFYDAEMIKKAKRASERALAAVDKFFPEESEEKDRMRWQLLETLAYAYLVTGGEEGYEKARGYAREALKLSPNRREMGGVYSSATKYLAAALYNSERKRARALFDEVKMHIDS